MNAKVGADNFDFERVMVTHGCGDINDNSERLVDLCMNNNLVIGGTIFPHKNIHKLTKRWYQTSYQASDEPFHNNMVNRCHPQRLVQRPHRPSPY